MINENKYMEKIKKLFKSAAHKLGGLKKPIEKIWQPIRARIFWKKEEAKKKKMIMIAVWVVAVAILSFAVWFGLSNAFSADSKAKNASAAVTAKAIIITSNKCGKDACWDARLFISALQAKGVIIDKVVTTTIESYVPVTGGVVLAKKYGITKVPTVILEFTGDNKPDLTQFFNVGLGNIIDDNKFVLSRILAPYYDVKAKNIKGLVNIIYLGDKSCTACYDPKLHETALKNLGVDTSQATSLDTSSAEGKALIAKYNLTKVPTAIITGEVAEYSALVETWPSVGIIANDGAYIFTHEELMTGSYKDLKTGKVITIKAPTTTN